jgi:hypothetical protein
VDDGTSSGEKLSAENEYENCDENEPYGSLTLLFPPLDSPLKPISWPALYERRCYTPNVCYNQAISLPP